MIKFQHTRLCFYLFSSMRGELQNYNAAECSARRAGKVRQGAKDGARGSGGFVDTQPSHCLKALNGGDG